MTLSLPLAGRRSPWSVSPATSVYAVVLLVTTLLLAVMDAQAAQSLLESQSTNLANLGSDPLQVLVSSAFWLSDPFQLLVVASALPLLAAAEARLGTRRWLGTFALGHVGATLLVAVGLFAATASGLVSMDAVADVVDVGFSYGACAVIGAAALTMPAESRRLTFAVLVGAIGVDTLLGADLATSAGHALAALLGVASAVILAARPASAHHASAHHATGHHAMEHHVMEHGPFVSAAARARVSSTGAWSGLLLTA